MVISGRVLSWPSCEALDGALVELWGADDTGAYTDERRATLRSNPDGTYEVDTAFPGRYEQRPHHVHIKVSVHGHTTLVTQLYPDPGTGVILTDLVLLEIGAAPPVGFVAHEPREPLR